MSEKPLPRLLWQGTCPMVGIVAQKDWLYRCIETATGPGSSRDPLHDSIVVEQQSPDAMGIFRWETVTFGPARNCVLEQAVMSLSGPVASSLPHIPHP